MGAYYTYLFDYIYKILWRFGVAYASSLPSIRLSPSRSSDSLHMDRSESEAARLSGRRGRERDCLLSSLSSSSRLGDAVLHAVVNASSPDTLAVVVVVADEAAATAATAAAAAAPPGN